MLARGEADTCAVSCSEQRSPVGLLEFDPRNKPALAISRMNGFPGAVAEDP
jgi:hypothetical protein